MRKKELCYILVVAVLGVSLLLGFAVEVFNLNLGSAAWIAHWVSSPIALAIGFVFALVFGVVSALYIERRYFLFVTYLIISRYRKTQT